MEAISTSVPTSINLHKPHPKTHHFHHLKPPFHHLHPHLSTTTTVTSKPPSSLSSKPSYYHYSHTQPTTQPTKPPIKTHTNPATGYAAALVDAALGSNTLHAVYKDVKRLLKWLNGNETLKGVMSDMFVDEGVKGRVVSEVVVKGKLQRRVVAMVKMLVRNNKSGMVVVVMEEFERIYVELNNTSLMVVV